MRSMFTRSLRFGFVGLLVFAVSTWASSTPVGPSTVQGDVKDSKGQPVAGAEMHIRAKDGSGFYRIAHTDANGHYAVSKLPNTDYEVVLFFNGAVKATINNTKTFANKPTARFQIDWSIRCEQSEKTHPYGLRAGGNWEQSKRALGRGR